MTLSKRDVFQGRSMLSEEYINGARPSKTEVTESVVASLEARVKCCSEQW